MEAGTEEELQEAEKRNSALGWSYSALSCNVMKPQVV